MTHHIPGPAGRIEALIDDPGALCTTGDPASMGPGGPRVAVRGAVVLAHPHPLYGGTMHTKAVFQAAKAFCRLGCAVIRFNFRGVGASQGRFDEGRGERLDFSAVVDHAAARFPGAPIWAAGVSFGSRIAMTEGAVDDRVQLMVGVAVPAGMHDFAEVRGSVKPKYFIHGERDEICPLKDTRALYAACLEPKDLVVIDTADHLFSGQLTEMADALEQLLR